VEPSLSVIIPTFNRRHSLLRLLESIEAQTMAVEEYEVIIILDGCTDGSDAALKRRAQRCDLRTLSQPNSGQASARNAGIGVARGRVCLFLDDDIELLPGALAIHLAAHVVSQPRAVLGTLEAPPNASASHRRRQALRLSRLPTRVAAEGGPVPVSYFYSGHVSLPKEAVPSGGFRAELRRLEDAELATRLVLASVPLVFLPAARAFVHDEKSRKEVLADAFREGESLALLWRADPEASRRVTRGDRPRRSIWQVGCVRVGAALPIPHALGALPGRVQWRYPGRSRLLRAMWLQAYFRGAGKHLRGLESWKAFINRPGELGDVPVAGEDEPQQAR